MAVLLGDLKWCFDTLANPVIELALMRLGAPAFYATMPNDIALRQVHGHCRRSHSRCRWASRLPRRSPAAARHRSGHDRGAAQLAPCLPVADIVIAAARAASTNPVAMPTSGGAPVEIPVAVQWATRRSPSLGQSRTRRSDGWSIRWVSCTIFLASNAELRSVCGFGVSGVWGF